MMESACRHVVAFDRFSGFESQDLEKFVNSVVAAHGDDAETLALCIDGAAQIVRSRSRTRVAHGVRETIQAFQPDVVVYVPSPGSVRSTFLRGHALRRAAPDAAHVMVSLFSFPETRLPRAVLRMLYPGPILVPSYKSLLSLSRMSLDGDVLTPGVDLATYRPPKANEKAAVRDRLGFKRDDFVFVIGPQTPASGEALMAFERAGNVGVVAALEGEPDADSQRVRRVQQTDSPPEFYWLADCFVFSETDLTRSTEMPMSVMESLACGVPVLTTPIGGLRDFFVEGDDLYYWETTDQLIGAARRLRENYPSRVRAMQEFTWQKVVEQISNDVLL